MAVPGELIICKKGHYYDPSHFSECPFCKKEQSDDAFYKTRGEYDTGSASGIRYVGHAYKDQKKDDPDATVAVAVQDMGFHPLAGWLVCVDGAGKGLDYKIRCGRNFIGRDRTMDICLQGDNTISRKNHSSISYDDKTNKYYYTPGMNRSIDHDNGTPVFSTVELKKGDRIEIGFMKLVFIPLCSNRFKWEDWKEEQDAL